MALCASIQLSKIRFRSASSIVSTLLVAGGPMFLTSESCWTPGFGALNCGSSVSAFITLNNARRTPLARRARPDGSEDLSDDARVRFGGHRGQAIALVADKGENVLQLPRLSELKSRA